MRFISILVLGGLVSPALGTTIIDFEDWTGGSGDQTSITSGGFAFSLLTGGSFFIAPHPEGGNPTLSLQMRSGVLLMSRGDGAPFSVISLDLQEGLPTNPGAVVSLTGIVNDGVGVKELFWLDGLPDTYETFYPVEFIAIDHLELHEGRTFSLDNIVIPEPGTLSMLVLALCLLHKPCS